MTKRKRAKLIEAKKKELEQLSFHHEELETLCTLCLFLSEQSSRAGFKTEYRSTFYSHFNELKAHSTKIRNEIAEVRNQLKELQ